MNEEMLSMVDLNKRKLQLAISECEPLAKDLCKGLDHTRQEYVVCLAAVAIVQWNTLANYTRLTAHENADKTITKVETGLATQLIADYVKSHLV